MIKSKRFPDIKAKLDTLTREDFLGGAVVITTNGEVKSFAQALRDFYRAQPEWMQVETWKEVEERRIRAKAEADSTEARFWKKMEKWRERKRCQTLEELRGEVRDDGSTESARRPDELRRPVVHPHAERRA